VPETNQPGFWRNKQPHFQKETKKMDEGSADPVIGNCYENDFLPPFQSDIDLDSILNDFDPAVFDETQANSLL
jgi:hypothetical protein